MRRITTTSDLYEALEGFGRRGRRLDAARLETVPDVLVALRGADVLVDPDARRALAQEVAAVLHKAIDDIGDPVDHRIAQVILASAPEFYDKTVTERLREVYVGDQSFTPEQFKSRRARIVAEIEARLASAFSASTAALPALSGGLEAAARDLTWHVQELELYITVLHAVTLEAENLRGSPDVYESVRARLTRRNDFSDRALWEYARCELVLSRLAASPVGRAFIRSVTLDEFLDGIDGAFVERQRASLMRFVARYEYTDAAPFVDALESELSSERISPMWSSFLSAVGGESADSFARGSAKSRPQFVDRVGRLTDTLLLTFPDEKRDPDHLARMSLAWFVGHLGPEPYSDRTVVAQLTHQLNESHPLGDYVLRRLVARGGKGFQALQADVRKRAGEVEVPPVNSDSHDEPSPSP